MKHLSKSIPRHSIPFRNLIPLLLLTTSPALALDITKVPAVALRLLPSLVLNRLSDQSINQFSEKQLQALTHAQLNRVNAKTLSRFISHKKFDLTSEQVQGITASRLNLLSETDIKQLHSQELKGLSPAQVSQLDDRHQVNLLLNKYGPLKYSLYREMRPSAIYETVERRGMAFGQEQVESLTGQQVANLKHSTIVKLLLGTPRMTAKQIESLSPSQINALKPEEIRQLEMWQIDAIGKIIPKWSPYTYPVFFDGTLSELVWRRRELTEKMPVDALGAVLEVNAGERAVGVLTQDGILRRECGGK